MLDLHGRVKMVEKFCVELLTALKAEVAGRGGLVDGGGGRQLALIQQQQRPLRFAEAWPLVSPLVPAVRQNDVFGISKGELEKCVKDAASKGRKGKDWQELLERLEQVGALDTKIINRLEVTRGSAASIGTKATGAIVA